MTSPAVQLIDWERDRDELHPTVRACVEFLAERERWVTAMRRHVPGSHGLCASHRERWPCGCWVLAEAARQLSESRLVPRESGRQ